MATLTLCERSHKMPRIVAIDPGTTHTGIVYMDERRIIDAKTISYPKACGIDNYLLDERCQNIWRQLEQFLVMHGHDVVVIEGYIPYITNRGASRATSHQTPWLVGYLLSSLESIDITPTIQTSKQVLNPRTKGNLSNQKDLLEQGRFVYEGQKLLTNDHLRCAFLHGLYYLIDTGEVIA